MPKNIHEIRDPIHVFVRLDTDERRVLDSRPVQRLRHIHQLAMSYLVYPGATHRRFEHALGVMELAGRVFDVVTRPDTIHEDIRRLLGEITQGEKLGYWRRVLRMAALCHDIGHLPFSHAAEKDLLPTGWTHEHLSVEFIRSDEMQELWLSMTPPLRTEDIVKLAVGPKELKGVHFTDWEAVLSEIIVGDAFGVDRMDYLLRDSHHAGVSYGRFDHFRLIDTLRILPKVPESTDGSSKEPMLGVDMGGIHSAEALLLARYFMFTQVYFHPIRRMYDIHLIDFLREWLPEGKFPTSAENILKHNDISTLSAIIDAADDPGKRGHEPARRIVQRHHFKVAYSWNPDDIAVHPDPGLAIRTALEDKYGIDRVRRDNYTQTGAVFDFPVQDDDSRIVSSASISDTLKNIPMANVDYVFVDPDYRDEAKNWLELNRNNILSQGLKEME